MLPRHEDSSGPVTLAEMVEAAVASDPGSRRIIAEAGSALGRATALIANLVNPELVIIGGELAGAGELLLEPMRRSMELGTLSSALSDLKIVQGGTRGGRGATGGVTPGHGVGGGVGAIKGEVKIAVRRRSAPSLFSL
jgi:predicted NBD/HSP70 family sugar kinase